jgi:Domain of unknown function (DUF4296)
MKPSVWFCIVMFVLCFSCSNRKQIPSNILGQEAMVKILFDIALAEEFAISYKVKDPKIDKDSAIALEVDKVFKIHKISQEKFRTSYEFYKSRPDLFRVIVDTVYSRSLRERGKLFKTPPAKVE